MRRCWQARPTAVNLAWAVDRVAGVPRGVAAVDRVAVALAEARAIEAEEDGRERRDRRVTAPICSRDATAVVTHCNTGALAAPGAGRRWPSIAELARAGASSEVLATESRPLLQGARLTVYELARLEHPARADRRLGGRWADRRRRGRRGDPRL